MKVRYHPDARAELSAAAEWYEERRPMLGQDLQTEVRRAEALIAGRPATCFRGVSPGPSTAIGAQT